MDRKSDEATNCKDAMEKEARDHDNYCLRRQRNEPINLPPDSHEVNERA